MCWDLWGQTENWFFFHCFWNAVVEKGQLDFQEKQSHLLVDSLNYIRSPLECCVAKVFRHRDSHPCTILIWTKEEREERSWGTGSGSRYHCETVEPSRTRRASESVPSDGVFLELHLKAMEVLCQQGFQRQGESLLHSHLIRAREERKDRSRGTGREWESKCQCEAVEPRRIQKM